LDYRYLGSTGLKVSPLCLGCMTFGEGADETTAHEMLDRFVAAGGNFIDTANNYAGGLSEEIVGRWRAARGNRQNMIVGTKVRFPVGPGPNDVGLTRKHITDSVEASLRRLQTDYIDLYQAHCWDHVTPLEETLRAFDDLVSAGKVRYIGASNFTGWHLAKAVATSAAHNWVRFESLQTQYSLITRSPEWDILPACRAEGVGVTIWSPLGAGWLSGKYRRDTVPPPESRMAHAAQTPEEWEKLTQIGPGATIPHPHKVASEAEFKRLQQVQEAERRWRVIEAVGDVAQARGATHAQVALAWLLAQPGVTAPVIGVRTVAQLGENLGCLNVALSEGELAWLNEVSDPGLPYPHDFLAQYGPWR
jgi:aryl-alcohol dehydrogenase-like predicted oxidoreductase